MGKKEITTLDNILRRFTNYLFIYGSNNEEHWDYVVNGRIGETKDEILKLVKGCISYPLPDCETTDCDTCLERGICPPATTKKNLLNLEE